MSYVGYTIVGLDSDGCELVNRGADSLKAAKSELKIIMGDREYVESGLHKVEIRDGNDECVVDEFV